jgi:hypothetical protein
LTEGDFSETGDGPYTYTADTAVTEAGEYDVTLELAANAHGDGASNEHEFIVVSPTMTPTPAGTATPTPSAGPTPVPSPTPSPTATPPVTRPAETPATARPGTPIGTPTPSLPESATPGGGTTPDGPPTSSATAGLVVGERSTQGVTWRTGRVDAGERVALVVPDHADTPLRRVAFSPANATALNATVTSGQSPPSETTPLVEGRNASALTYLRLDHRAVAVGQPTLTLAVPRNRTAHPEAVAIYRRHDGDWQRHETQLVGTADGQYQLRATVPGLSTFAVGVRQSDAVVRSVTVPHRTVSAGDPLAVTATVASADGGPSGVDTVALRLDGTVVARKTVRLPAEGTRTVRFDPSGQQSGAYSLAVGDHAAGMVRIAPAGPCGLSCVLPPAVVAAVLAAAVVGIHRYRELPAARLLTEVRRA